MASGVTQTGGFGAVGRVFQSKARQIVSESAHDVLSDAQESILTGPKTGHIYNVGGETTVTFNRGKGIPFKRRHMEKTVTFNKGKAGREHQASAPGEAPANDLGGLAGNSFVEVHPSKALATVVFAEEYANTLETGGVHIEPRPFLKPAVTKNEEAFIARVASALNEAVNEASI